MDEDLQGANTIIQKEFGRRRFKIVDSIVEIKNKCILVEISHCHSPSIVLYYKDKNEDNVEETCHFGNLLSFSLNNDITRIDLSLYCIGEDELKDSMFRLH